MTLDDLLNDIYDGLFEYSWDEPQEVAVTISRQQVKNMQKQLALFQRVIEIVERFKSDIDSPLEDLDRTS